MSESTAEAREIVPLVNTVSVRPANNDWFVQLALDASELGPGFGPAEAELYDEWVRSVEARLNDLFSMMMFQPRDLGEATITFEAGTGTSDDELAIRWEDEHRQIIALFDVARFKDSGGRDTLMIKRKGAVQYTDVNFEVFTPVELKVEAPKFWFGKADYLRNLHGRTVEERIDEFWTLKSLSRLCDAIALAVRARMDEARTAFLEEVARHTDAMALRSLEIAHDWSVLHKMHSTVIRGTTEYGRVVVAHKEAMTEDEMMQLVETLARRDLRHRNNRNSEMQIVVKKARRGDAIYTRTGTKSTDIGHQMYTVPEDVPPTHVIHFIDWTIVS